jgi:uncharacterized membrane protein
MEQFLPTLTVAGVLALLAPLGTTALKRLTWGPQVKQLLAVVVAILVALFAITVTDGWNDIPGTENPMTYVLTAILVVIAVAQLAFKLIFEPLGIEAKIAAATATKTEKAAFLTENTVRGTTIVDSTESKTAEAVAETDETPPAPGWTPKH